MQTLVLIPGCVWRTVLVYPQWVIPLLLLRIVPLRIESGFRFWQRWLAPHRHGDPGARSAADANFMILLGLAKAWPLRRRTAWEMALLPLTPLVTILIGVGQIMRHGPGVRNSHGIGLPRQFLEFYQLHLENPGWLFLVSPQDWYYRRRMYEPSRRTYAAHSVPDPGKLVSTTTVLWTRHQRRRRAAAPSDRKSQQTARLCAAGLPAIPVLALLGNGCEEFPDGGMGSVPQDLSLFTKPDAGHQSLNTQAWDFIEPGRYRQRCDDTARDWSLEALIAHLKRQPFVSVLQALQINHAALRDLTGNTLCTFRILTYTDPVTLEAKVFPFSWMKIARAGAIADMVLGPGPRSGLAASIDMESGVLGPAYAADLTTHHVHPDFGSPITGRTVPRWRESVSLALAAHEAYRPHGWGWGWDIAVTETGPVVLEGNSHPWFSEELFGEVTFGGLEAVNALTELCIRAEQSGTGTRKPQ